MEKAAQSTTDPSLGSLGPDHARWNGASLCDVLPWHGHGLRCAPYRSARRCLPGAEVIDATAATNLISRNGG